MCIIKPLLFNAHLVEKNRQLPVGQAGLVGHQRGHSLLVCGSQAVVHPVAVLEPEQLLAHQVPALAGPPQLGRAQAGHVQLLTADALHLLVNYPHLLVWS